MSFPHMDISWIHILIIVFLAVSAAWDLRYRRIPNFMTYPAAIAAVAYHAFSGGLTGLYFSLCGLSFGILLLIIFYFLGGMGAGDVKLMGAIGAMLGPGGVFDAFLFTAVIGGMYAVLILLRHGLLVKTLRHYGQILWIFVLTKQFMMSPALQHKKTPALCYGIAIALGTGLSIFGQIAGWNIHPPFIL
jgi:prepilin peptidase CpaA